MKIVRWLLAVALMSGSVARAELKPDEIALIVNRNSPDSAEVAEYYVKARQLPADRIIALDLPATDDISFDQYQQQVVPQVRHYLDSHGLREKIKCLITSYGVPLRIEKRNNTADETAELNNVRSAFADAQKQLTPRVWQLEKRVTELDPAFKPRTETTALAFAMRVDAALKALEESNHREEAVKFRQQFVQPVSTNFSDPTTMPSTAPAAAPLSAERHGARVAAAKRGMVFFARALEGQIEELDATSTDAALDSELALLWWPDYPRGHWVFNPMFYRLMNQRAPQTLMTVRLDGPSPKVVHDLIDASIAIERDGLKGAMVVDAGGGLTRDPQRKEAAFTQFDVKLVALSKLVKDHTKLRVLLDEKAEVLPASSVEDVALYTGWYALGDYTPACKFARGAVAYHIASLEMTTLHSPGTKQWCFNLLKDGAAATIGAVGEPYLGAFPLPGDFFPLLLTGKLPLAECYWRTNPMASWKMCIVGDPLYTPFKANPALDASDLPAHLQTIFAR